MSSASLVSVVIPTHNRPAATARAVRSVLAQTLDDLEVVVVDDGSTDDTADVVAGIGDHRISVMRIGQSGAAAARNAGAARARGRWLSFLDSDHTAEPRWLEAMVAVGESEGAVLVSCGMSDFLEGTEERVGSRLPDDGGPALCGLTALVITGGTYMLDRALFLELGGFDPEQRAAQHTELALRLLPEIAARGLSTAAVGEPLVNRFIGRDDHMRDDDTRMYEGGRRLIEKHHAHLALDPPWLANLAAGAGYRAVRIGKLPEARRLFWLAARSNPGRPRHWGRLGLSLVPPVARRFWGRDRVDG